MNNALIERLAILNEECSEVQHIISKILRHGMDSYNPLDDFKISNSILLGNELGDLLYSIGMVISAEDVSETSIATHVSLRNRTIKEYLHSNENIGLTTNTIMQLFHFKDYASGMIATDKTGEQIWEAVIKKAGLKGSIELNIVSPLRDVFIDYFNEITTEL